MFHSKKPRKYNFSCGVICENRRSEGQQKPRIILHRPAQKHLQGLRCFSPEVDPGIATINHAKSQNVAHWELPDPSAYPFQNQNEHATVWRNREDWRIVSRVLDRLGLIFTFLSVVALCLFLFIGINA